LLAVDERGRLHDRGEAMSVNTKDDERERQVRRLAVMLGRIHVMGDLEAITPLDPAAVDAEADEYETATHVLHERWESYLEPARAALDVMLAPATTAEQRAAVVHAMEEELRASEA
jgi:hypothetical protein